MSSEFSLADGRKRAAFTGYFILSLLALILAVVTLVFCSRFKWLLPACFLTAALTEVSHVIYCIMRDDKNHRSYGWAAFWGVAALVLTILGIISIIAYV